MSELSRLFTALILSMAAIFAYNYFFVTPKIERKQEALQNAQSDPANNNANVQAQAQGTNQTPKPAGDMPAGNSRIADVASELSQMKSQQTREQALAEGYSGKRRVPISTDRIHGSINLVGGMLDDIALAKYHQTLDKNSAEVALLSPRRTPSQYFLSTGWISQNAATAIPNDNTVWKLVKGTELTTSTPVTISYDNGAGLIFSKTFSVDEKYMLSVHQYVENKSGQPVTISPFGLINRTYDMKTKQVYVSHEGPMAVADKKLNEAKYKSLQKDGNQEFKNVSGWIGIGDKYWLTSIIPQNSTTEKVDIAFKYYQKDGIDRFQADILSQPVEIAPGSTSEYAYNIYTGAKQIRIIEDYKKKLNIDLFDRAIDFGGLYFLTKPMLKALIFFHSKLGNMGLAIMLLTICVRLILFPLANKSYSSMARMKKHMPEIAKIKERNKSDRQKQGTEMMKYYREHKINPAAGCLPVFVQIPIFFSLYKVLYVTIEMRHEPFFWFIHDLSAPDPTNIFNLFGLVAWSIPAWLPHIGILPILFSTSMVIQQRLNPPMADESQKIIMKWIPWIFLFIFSNFAAGLVVYWIWNNTLSIIQQYVITRRINRDRSQ